MKKSRIIKVILFLMFSLLLVACGKENASNESVSENISVEESSEESSEEAQATVRIVEDGLGRKVELPEKLESIVCSGVGALRYTSYLKATDLVVGVEDYEKETSLTRLYNHVNYEHFKDLPVIGTNCEPNIEQIIQVNPQLIVVSSSVKMDPDTLAKKTGIPVFSVPGSDTTLDDKAFETIDLLGMLYEKTDEAKRLRTYLEDLKKDLEKRTASVEEEKKLSAYVGGVSFKGRHGFEGTEAGYGPFKLIHAKNMADTTNQEGAFNVDLEKILEWDPEVIFIDYNGLDLVQSQYEENPDFFQELQAVKNGKIYSQVCFRSYASNLDTALADAYYAGSILFPNKFSDIQLDEKISEIYTNLLGKDPSKDLIEAGYEFKELKLGE